jgi:hypothetical protein
LHCAFSPRAVTTPPDAIQTRVQSLSAARRARFLSQDSPGPGCRPHSCMLSVSARRCGTSFLNTVRLPDPQSSSRPSRSPCLHGCEPAQRLPSGGCTGCPAHEFDWAVSLHCPGSFSRHTPDGEKYFIHNEFVTRWRRNPSPAPAGTSHRRKGEVTHHQAAGRSVDPTETCTGEDPESTHSLAS